MAPITYISLFSGAGGLDLGLRIAVPSARCVCFCEGEAAAVKVLAARIEEGSLEDAPIWSDVRSFPSECFRGRVDGIIGGFPCQDLSVAGQGAGIHAGEKSSLWFDYLRIIEEVQPSWVFIENVPGIFNAPGSDLESEDEPNGESAEWLVRNIDAVLGPLSSIGFNAEWLTLRASDVRAAHQRKRWFCLAYRPGTSILGHYKHSERWTEHKEHGNPYGRNGSGRAGADVDDPSGEHRGVYQRSGYEPGSLVAGRGGSSMGHSIGAGLEERGCEPIHDGQECAATERAGDALADAGRERDQRRGVGGELVCSPRTPEGISEQRQRRGNPPDGIGHLAPFDIPGPGLGAAGVIDDILKLYARSPERAWARYQAELRNTVRWANLLVRYPWLQPAIAQKEAESHLHGLPDGMAAMVANNRTDALRLCGNGCVPIQVACSFIELARRIA